MSEYAIERVPRGYQQLTVSNTAIAITVPAGATRAVVYVEAQPIRWRDDATAPTSSVGTPATAASTFELPSIQSMKGFKAIRSGGTDATLNITYYGA